MCVCVCVCIHLQAVVAFVRALCTVSREELENVKAPRMFSLTCLVQVAHFNMKRIRYDQCCVMQANDMRALRICHRALYCGGVAPQA